MVARLVLSLGLSLLLNWEMAFVAYAEVTGNLTIVGNGGAPLTSGVNYGYAVVARNASGTLTSTAYDYMTHAVLDVFSVQANGAGA